MRRYPYAQNRQLMTGGIPWQLPDSIPAPVRAANEAIGAAKQAEHAADTEVGRLTLATQAAALADSQAHGQALADGLPDPGNEAVAKHQTKLDAAKRVAEATRVATLVCENRLLQALQAAHDSGELAATVKTLDNKTTEDLAAANEHLDQARALRETALLNRVIARYLDAWPQSSLDPNYTPDIGDLDLWNRGLAGIRQDLASITESKPLSLLPEDQRGRRQEIKPPSAYTRGERSF